MLAASALTCRHFLQKPCPKKQVLRRAENAFLQENNGKTFLSRRKILRAYGACFKLQQRRLTPASSSRLGGLASPRGWLLAARAASTAAGRQDNLQQPAYRRAVKKPKGNSRIPNPFKPFSFQ